LLVVVAVALRSWVGLHADGAFGFMGKGHRLPRAIPFARESVATPFVDLAVPPAELQPMLRRDIGRRYSELLALGWLGRAYSAIPSVFQMVLPAVFQLEPYDEESSYERAGVVRCTLRESSVVTRGVPLHFILQTDVGPAWRIRSATLLGIGCDLRTGPGEGDAAEMSGAAVRALCDEINTDGPTKKLLVDAIVEAVFGKLMGVGEAIRKNADLEACGDGRRFVPRREVFGLEGSTEKWLQKVSGYYFAESILQDVRFASSAGGVSFTFYWDPTEPVNSENLSMNINPEVLHCRFMQS